FQMILSFIFNRNSHYELILTVELSDVDYPSIFCNLAFVSIVCFSDHAWCFKSNGQQFTVGNYKPKNTFSVAVYQCLGTCGISNFERFNELIPILYMNFSSGLPDFHTFFLMISFNSSFQVS
ncbi:hypothetical protein L9F63_008784, partial [Diploptera punctata]